MAPTARVVFLPLSVDVTLLQAFKASTSWRYRCDAFALRSRTWNRIGRDPPWSNVALTDVPEWVVDEKQPVVVEELGELSTTQPEGKSLTVSNSELRAGPAVVVVTGTDACVACVAAFVVVGDELPDEQAERNSVLKPSATAICLLMWTMSAYIGIGLRKATSAAALTGHPGAIASMSSELGRLPGDCHQADLVAEQRIGVMWLSPGGLSDRRCRHS